MIGKWMTLAAGTAPYLELEGIPHHQHFDLPNLFFGIGFYNFYLFYAYIFNIFNLTNPSFI
jgi:hypothetical protein